VLASATRWGVFAYFEWTTTKMKELNGTVVIAALAYGALCALAAIGLLIALNRQIPAEYRRLRAAGA
jgi:hypothetical protein